MNTTENSLRKLLTVSAVIAAAGMIGIESYAATITEQPVSKNNEVTVQTEKVKDVTPVYGIVYYDAYTDVLNMTVEDHIHVHGRLGRSKAKWNTLWLDTPPKGWDIRPSSIHTTYRITGASIGDESKAVGAPVYENGRYGIPEYIKAKHDEAADLYVSCTYEIAKDLLIGETKPVRFDNNGNATVNLPDVEGGKKINVTGVMVQFSDGSKETLDLGTGAVVGKKGVTVQLDSGKVVFSTL